jgi:hypothetical protein
MAVSSVCWVDLDDCAVWRRFLRAVEGGAPRASGAGAETDSPTVSTSLSNGPRLGAGAFLAGLRLAG